MLPLKWAQVDRSEKTIRLDPGTTKTSEGRVLPYGLLTELEAIMEGAWAEHKYCN